MLPASLCAKIMVFRRITRIIEVVLNERAVVLLIYSRKILQIIRINGIFWVILWEMMNFLQKKVMRNNSECRSCVVLVHVVWQIKGVYA